MSLISRLFICLSMVVANPLIAQQLTFQKVYPGEFEQVMAQPYETIQTSDGGYLTGNYTTFMKVDSLGTVEWRLKRLFGSNFTINVHTVTKNFSGGYLTAGTTLINMLDSNCDISWMKRIIYNQFPVFLSSAKAPNNTFILGGAITDNNIGVPILVKIDTLGNVLWSKVYKSFKTVEAAYSLVVTADGGIVAMGSSGSTLNPGSYFDCVVFKTDSNGVILWSKRYTALNQTYQGNCMRALQDGGYIVAGIRNLNSYLMKIDSLGNVVWKYKYDPGSNSTSWNLTLTNDNGFAIVGNKYGPGGSATTLLTKTDSAGIVQWARTLGGYYDVWASHILQTRDGGFAISGRRPVSNDFCLSLIKTDSLGFNGGCYDGIATVTATALNDTVIDFIISDSSVTITTIPYTATFPPVGSEIVLCAPNGVNEYESVQNNIEIAPNPSNGTFILSFNHIPTEPIKMELIDLLGNTIYKNQTLLSNLNFEVAFPEKVKNGIYICRIISSTGTINIKVVLER